MDSDKSFSAGYMVSITNHRFCFVPSATGPGMIPSGRPGTRSLDAT